MLDRITPLTSRVTRRALAHLTAQLERFGCRYAARCLQAVALCSGLMSAAVSQAATVSLGEATVSPGQSQAPLPLLLTVGSGEQLSALVVDIHVDPSFAEWQSVLLEPPLTALGKQVQFNLVAEGHARVVVYGLDRQVLPSGTLAHCLVRVPSSAASGTTIVSLRDGLWTDPDGNEQPLASQDGRLWIDAPADTTPPQISGITVSEIDALRATMAWSTDEASTSQVAYGIGADLNQSTPVDSILTTRHRVQLLELTPGALYQFLVRSRDAAGNEGVSVVSTFSTSGIVAAVAIAPGGGAYSGAVTVALSTATGGAAIRYTLDGNDPTENSSLYGQPFVLPHSGTVAARAFNAGMEPSAVARAAFVIQAETVSGITASAAQAIASSSQWRTSGAERYCWNANQWLEFRVDFGSGGSWVVAVTATNQNSSTEPGLPSGYAFQIAVHVNGGWKGTVQVPGSTTTYQTGRSSALAMPPGVQTVRLTWTNDIWSAGRYDANLRVRSVAFTPQSVSRASAVPTAPSTPDAGTGPSVVLVWPVSSIPVSGAVVELQVAVAGVAISLTDAHLHIRLDGGTTWHVYNTKPFYLRELPVGQHHVEVELVDSLHRGIAGTRARVSTTFTVH